MVLGYACPTFPFGSDVVVTSSGALVAAAIMIERLLVAVCAGGPEAVTVTVKVEVPAAVGVPEMAPVVPFSESRPAGSPAARST